MNIHRIDQINLDKLVRKYRLLDKLSANHLTKLGYYRAIEVRGGPEKSKLGKRLSKKQRKSLRKIESHLENMLSQRKAEKFLQSLESIIDEGERKGILGDTDAMIEEANDYCREHGIEDETIKENIVIFTELFAFGYRYKAEGGLPENEGEDEKSGKRKRAEERVKAVDRRQSSGKTGIIKRLLSF